MQAKGRDPTVNTLPYRRLMCDVIKQAINWAYGRQLADYLTIVDPNDWTGRKAEEIRDARKYLLSDDFRDDCELIGLDCEPIRKKVFSEIKRAKQVKRDRDNARYQPERVWYR